MPEIGTSGSMSGDGKRSVAAWPKRPRPSSTLPPRRFAAVRKFGRDRSEADMPLHWLRTLLFLACRGRLRANCPADFPAHRCNAAASRIRRRTVGLVCTPSARLRRQDGGARIDQHQAAANGGAGKPHLSHHGSKPLCAAGTLGAQPSMRLCLFDSWKRPFHRGRKA
jgi:hypothetical protein